MVILETAAIGAAGYGLYRGGEAGVRKAKEGHKEFKREQNRRNNRNELAAKSSARQDRIAQIQASRTAKPAATSETSVDDRHKQVMAKLKNKPETKKKKLFSNPFKRK